MDVDPAVEIAELRALISGQQSMISTLQDRLDSKHRVWWSRRRKVPLVGVVALAAVAATGVAAASGPSNLGLNYVTVSPAFKLATNASVGAGKVSSYVVIGASTTVPTDATTVRLDVTVKGTSSGTLSIYPLGNTGGGSGQSLSWSAGGSTSGTVMENVGSSNKLAFFNASGAPATLTATITGYSTQVAADDISGVGGSPGQVLTNNGSTSTWTPAGGPAYAVTSIDGTPFSLGSSGGFVTIARENVPAGVYAVSASVSPYTPVSNSRTECAIFSPGGLNVADGFVDTNQTVEMLALSGLLTTNGGAITLQCDDFNKTGLDFPNDPSLVAVQVSSGSGSVTPFTHATSPAAPAHPHTR